MRAMVRRLSASILILSATVALAQAQVRVEDTTPCDKVIRERVTVPDDFSLVFRSGPVQAFRGISTITKLNASGQTSIETVRRGGARQARPAMKIDVRRCGDIRPTSQS